MRGKFPLHPQLRVHFWVGALLAIWLYLFLALVGPFDTADLPLRIRSLLMIGYGIIFWATYFICILLQHRLLTMPASWNISRELLFVLLFLSVCYIPSYAYYRTDWVNGTYSASEFLLWVYLPTLVVLLPFLLVARHSVGLQYTRRTKVAPSIILRGNTKLDVLKLTWSDLVAVSAANNYVTVYYQHADGLQKRLLRTTLKQIRQDAPALVQIHRSHLINLTHFCTWKDSKQIIVHDLLLPVSKKYRPTLQEVIPFTPQ